jgi:putative copper resistance protein D
MRLILLAVTLPAHAWLGVSIMSDSAVIAGDYYRDLARPWGPTLLHDQSIGGGLLWAAGDLVGLIVVAALVVQWVRADSREALRVDRRLDRGQHLAAQRASAALSAGAAGGDAGGTGGAEPVDEWTAYNARLAQLAALSANDHGETHRPARRGTRKSP